MQNTNPSAQSDIRHIFSLDYGELLKEGVSMRNAGFFHEAEIALLATTRLRPAEWQPKYELGALYLSQKEPRKAVVYLEEAFALNQGEPRLVERLASCHTVLGNFSNAEEILRRALLTDYHAVTAIAENAQYVEYVRAYPIEYAQSVHQEITEKSGPFLSAQDVFQRIVQSIENRQPFSLVRLGDGEGTWLHRVAHEEALFGTLYERNRKEFWNIWFGKDKAENIPYFYRATEQICNELSKVDVLGIPPMSWIAHEYATGNLRGTSGTLNACRVANRFAGPGTSFCSQLIHYELDRKDMLRKILRGKEVVGAVSCHPGISDYIRHELGVQNVIYIPLPGEPSRRHLLGEESVHGEHFPERFEEILKDIEGKDYSGMIFLVAGGILGKLYTLRLRQSGAVALDIGSTADRWMNKKTRPGF